MDIAGIQRALAARGYDPGPVDGVWGRSTIAALTAFQRTTGLAPDGVLGRPTVAALNAGPAGRTIARAAAPILSGDIPAVWYAEARRRMGYHEVRDRPKLMAWLKSDGKTLGDPAKLPWCGDFVATCVALTLPAEPLPANPYLARNWLTFGIALREPSPGAVAVFWRGARFGTTDGHVAFYAGERTDAIRVLGGNQSNAVSEVWIARERLLGFRWPITVARPVAGPAASTAAGRLSTNEA